MAASSNPLLRGSRGCGIFVHQYHAAGGGNGSIMVGMFVCLCFASKKSSEREFFIPAGTHLAVKLLKASRGISYIFGLHVVCCTEGKMPT